MKIRVALVLYGQPRYVHLPYSYASHKWFLRKAEVAVFGHCWFSETQKEMSTSKWAGIRDLRFDPNSRTRILAGYPNSQIIFEAPLEAGNAFTTVEYANLLSHLTSLHKALSLFHVANRKSRFDFVILSRFDAVLLKFPKIEELDFQRLNLSNDHDRFPDFIIGGPPELISAVDALFLLNDLDPSKVPPAAETLKQEAFLKSFGTADLAIMKAISRPLRSGKYFKSIFQMIVNLAFVKFSAFLQTSLKPFLEKKKP